MSFNGRTRPADSSSSPLLTLVGSRPGTETSWPEASKILPDSSTCTGRVVDLSFLVDRDRITRTSGGIVDCGRRTREQLLHCAGCVKNIKSNAGVFRPSLNVDAGRPILHRHFSCLNPLACAGELRLCRDRLDVCRHVLPHGHHPALGNLRGARGQAGRPLAAPAPGAPARRGEVRLLELQRWIGAPGFPSEWAGTGLTSLKRKRRAFENAYCSMPFACASGLL